MCCLFVSSRVQTAKKEFKEQWKENVKKGGLIPSFDENLKRDLKGYIEHCTSFSWRILSQVPPLKIDYKTSTFNPSYLTESQAFASTAVRSSQGRWTYPQERVAYSLRLGQQSHRKGGCRPQGTHYSCNCYLNQFG